ncbi:hypothetical protein [Streptomyces salinarius]|uniref:hypothetical protein n=1 Tax=Streptomyces salinarius TaxID=2762598 RepID=UPI0028528B09|nr:hypothetical protein [Streptomyces salinarius]
MSPRRELTAAAARYTSRKIRTKPVDQSWQQRAWDFYDTTPEVRFAANWTANAMSGALLYAGYRDEDGTIQRAPDDHPAQRLVAQIAGGPDGQSQLLGDAGPHLTVAGEFWVVIRPRPEDSTAPVPDDPEAADEEWHVLSVREVRKDGNKMVAEIDGVDVEIPPYDPANPDEDAPVAIRVWESHPRRKLEADSPVRASLDLLEELQLLNAAVAAIARSRLTGRGIVIIPKGTRFPTTPTQGDAEDDLIEVLMTVAETAIREPDSAAATVPIILEVPPEMVGQIKRLTFESDFDELAIKLREEAIRRFATGLEMPAEILLGLGDTNHWGAWALTAEAIRLGIEPKCKTVAHAFTTQWLRPMLEAEGVQDWHRYMVWYDSSPLRVRTNRSETALKLFELGAISAEALRRETGFDESDAPKPEETAARRRQEERPADEEPADGTVTRLPVDESEAPPDTLAAADLAPLRTAFLTAADQMIGASLDRLLREHDHRQEQPPAPVTATSAVPGRDALVAAADGLVWHALTAAGRKLERTPLCPRSERARAREVQSAQLHTVFPVKAHQIDEWKLLDGVWARVPEIADRYGLDPACMTTALDTYCRELIAAGIVHSYDVVPGALSACTDYATAA